MLGINLRVHGAQNVKYKYPSGARKSNIPYWPVLWCNLVVKVKWAAQSGTLILSLTFWIPKYCYLCVVPLNTQNDLLMTGPL